MTSSAIPAAGAERRSTRRALVVGVIAFLLCILGFVIEPAQAYASYLAAYADVLTVVIGVLILAMITHVTAARWFAPLRPPSLALIATVPVLAVLFLPVLAGMHALYPWVPPVPVALRAEVAHKAAYLNVPFWIVRAAIDLGAWIVLAVLLRRWCHAHARAPSERLAARVRRLSAGGLVAIALTLTFASFDWLMSLSPSWYSTIFGVYVFAGGFVAALGLVAVVSWIAPRVAEGDRAPADRADYRAASLDRAAERSLAIGNLMLTFVIFWAYIAFSQLLVIWIGDVPKDASWYVTRVRGSWGVLGLVLIAGHFALPLVALLFRAVKRDRGKLAVVGAWLLVMHWVDVYWLVLPHAHPNGVRASWMDLVALVAVWALAAAFAIPRVGLAVSELRVAG